MQAAMFSLLQTGTTSFPYKAMSSKRQTNITLTSWTTRFTRVFAHKFTPIPTLAIKTFIIFQWVQRKDHKALSLWLEQQASSRHKKKQQFYNIRNLLRNKWGIPLTARATILKYTYFDENHLKRSFAIFFSRYSILQWHLTLDMPMEKSYLYVTKRLWLSYYLTCIGYA